VPPGPGVPTLHLYPATSCLPCYLFHFLQPLPACRATSAHAPATLHCPPTLTTCPATLGSWSGIWLLLSLSPLLFLHYSPVPFLLRLPLPLPSPPPHAHHTHSAFLISIHHTLDLLTHIRVVASYETAGGGAENSYELTLLPALHMTAGLAPHTGANLTLAGTAARLPLLLRAAPRLRNCPREQLPAGLFCSSTRKPSSPAVGTGGGRDTEDVSMPIKANSSRTAAVAYRFSHHGRRDPSPGAGLSAGVAAAA